MNIELPRLYGLGQINCSIEAVQNAIDGKPPRPCDYAPLIGLRGVLEAIRTKVFPRFAPPQSPYSQPAPQRKYTIEPHGDGYALYVGRDHQNHGLNLLYMSEPDPKLPILQMIVDALNAQEAQEHNHD